MRIDEGRFVTTGRERDVASGVLKALLTAAVCLPIWAMRPADFVKFGEPKYEAVILIAVTMLLVLLLDGLGRGTFAIPSSPFLWVLGALVLQSLAASLLSSDSTTAVVGDVTRRDGFLMVLANSTFFLVAYVVATRSSGSGSLTFLSRVLVVAAVPVFAYGVAQAFGLDAYVWEPSRGAGGRIFSTLGNPIFLAAYSTMVVLVAMGLWMEGGRGSMWWAVVTGAGAAVIVLTATRAAWLALALGLLLVEWVALRRGENRRLSAGMLVAVVVGVVITSTVMLVAPGQGSVTVADSVRTLADPSAARNEGRKAIWDISLRMVNDHPLLGVGPDLMGRRFEEYRTGAYDASEGSDRFADKPHSLLLEWAVETGLPGAALASALVVALVAVGARMAARGSPGRGWIIVGLWSAATAYTAQSLITVTAIGVDGLWWVLLGLIAGADGGFDDETSR